MTQLVLRDVLLADEYGKADTAIFRPHHIFSETGLLRAQRGDGFRRRIGVKAEVMNPAELLAELAGQDDFAKWRVDDLH